MLDVMAHIIIIGPQKVKIYLYAQHMDIISDLTGTETKFKIIVIDT
jgi:hypothetical protein